jgi:DNA-binding transcriptional LysR family regulator
LDYAERLLSLRAEMIAAVAAPAARPGHLRLGVAETIVQTWLPEFLSAVAAAFPKVAVEIEVDVSPNLRERLLAHDLDLAFLLGPTATPVLSDEPLCRYPLAFLAAPALKLGTRPLTLTDLAVQPIVTFARNTEPYALLMKRFAAAKLRPPPIHASASVATIARMAAAGLGVALLPPATVVGEISAGRLRQLQVRDPLPDLRFVASRQGRASPLIASIVEIAARIAEHHLSAHAPPFKERRPRGKRNRTNDEREIWE